jgi:hypothetical protein
VNALILATFAELSQARPEIEIGPPSGTHYSDTIWSEMWGACRQLFHGWPKSTKGGAFQPPPLMIPALFFNYFQPETNW